MDDYRKFAEDAVDFIESDAVQEEADRPYNYLKAYETDMWARAKGNEPIEFDWNRVCEVTAIELDKSWESNPLNLAAKKKGKKYTRVLVRCANPRHDYFRQVFSDPITEHGYKCQKCITEEMNRILSLRVIRAEETRRFAAGGN